MSESTTSAPLAHFTAVIEPAMGIGFRQSPSITELTKAMIAFQTAAPVVEKTIQGSKSRYADMADIWLQVVPVMQKCGLATFAAPGAIREVGPDNHAMAMCVRLAHASGEFMEHTGEIFIPAPIKSRDGAEVTNAAQRLGSAITYMRRYMLVTMLGVIVGDDDDAAHAFAQGRTGSKYVMDPEIMEKQGRPWQDQIKEGFACFECIAPHDPSLKMGDVENKDMPKLLRAEVGNGEQNQFVLAEAVRRLLAYAESELQIRGLEAFEKAILSKGWTGTDFWKMTANDITVLRAFFFDEFVKPNQKGGA